MSSQFSYEIDERQIKVMMLDAELNYTDASWQKFDESFNLEKKSSLHLTVPNINIGISRSIIVPIFFVIMIGGLSSLLFSFVDFKKKPEVIKEIILPVNKKKLPKSNSNLKPAIAVINKTITPIKQIMDTIQLKTIDTIIKKNITVEDKKVALKNTVSEKKNDRVITKVKSTVKIAEPQKKKKKNRRIAEELPIINAPISNLNEGNNELELDLK